MDNEFSHRPGFLTRVSLGLIGGNSARANWSGNDDQSRIRLLAVSICMLTAWVGFNVAHALSIATGTSLIAPATLVFSGLIAGMYSVVDLSLLQGRWWSIGRALARERGFGPMISRGAALKEGLSRLPFALMRLALAVAVALFSATSFALWWWQSDIQARMVADNIAANSELQQRVEAEFDADLQAITTELGQTDTRIAARLERATTDGLQSAATSAEKKLMFAARMSALTSQMAVIDDRIACVSRDVRAEEKGLTTCDGRAVTKAGKGRRHAAAVAELQLLQEDKARVAAEADATKSELAAIAPASAVQNADPEAKRRDSLRDKRSAMLADRGTEVRARMEAEPTFKPLQDGLLIRQKALVALTHDEGAVLIQIVIAKAMFLLLDLSVISIAFGGPAVSIYALAQVVEFETRASKLIAEGSEVLSASTEQAAKAEIGALETHLNLARARRALRDELRRIELAAQVLDDWADGVTQAGPESARFDA